MKVEGWGRNQDYTKKSSKKLVNFALTILSFVRPSTSDSRLCVPPFKLQIIEDENLIVITAIKCLPLDQIVKFTKQWCGAEDMETGDICTCLKLSHF